MADIDMLDEIKARLAAATPGPLRLWSDVRPDDFAMYRCADGSLHPFGSIFEHHDGLCQAALLVQRRGTKGWVPCRRVRAEGSHLCYQHGGQTTGRTSKATRLRGDLAYLVGEVERLRDLAAAVQAFAIAEEQIEEAVRQRGPDIGPESHRACVERMNLRAAAQVLLVTGDDGAVRRNR